MAVPRRSSPGTEPGLQAACHASLREQNENNNRSVVLVVGGCPDGFPRLSPETLFSPQFREKPSLYPQTLQNPLTLRGPMVTVESGFGNARLTWGGEVRRWSANGLLRIRARGFVGVRAGEVAVVA
jgi:hypothetical protein